MGQRNAAPEGEAASGADTGGTISNFDRPRVGDGLRKFCKAQKDPSRLYIMGPRLS